MISELLLCVLLFLLLFGALSLGIVLKRRSRARICRLDWPAVVKQKALADLCRAYFKYNNWMISETNDVTFNFRTASKGNIPIFVSVGNMRDRNATDELDYIRRLGRDMRYATSRLGVRALCVVNFEISEFARAAAREEAFIVLHFRELWRVNALNGVTADNVISSDFTQDEEYFLAGNRAICRNLAQKARHSGDLAAAIKWTQFATANRLQSAEDYFVLADLYKKTSDLVLAHRACLSAIYLDANNVSYQKFRDAIELEMAAKGDLSQDTV